MAWLSRHWQASLIVENRLMPPSDESMPEHPEHVFVNQKHWNDSAEWWIKRGERDWTAPEPRWGIWSIPESELQLLPADMDEAIELGCGTAYV